MGIAFVIVLSRHEALFTSLLTGFGAALFLLILNLATLGKGMGLGDVKLAIPLGMLLGWPNTFYWMTLSFVLGAAVGVFLIAIGKAHFGKHIPFGPFLVLGYLIILIAGSHLSAYMGTLTFL